MTETLDPMATDVDQQKLAQQLLAQAKEQGIDLMGPNGLLNQLTKNVLERVHVAYDVGQPLVCHPMPAISGLFVALCSKIVADLASRMRGDVIAVQSKKVLLV